MQASADVPEPFDEAPAPLADCCAGLGGGSSEPKVSAKRWQRATVIARKRHSRRRAPRARLTKSRTGRCAAWRLRELRAAARRPEFAMLGAGRQPRLRHLLHRAEVATSLSRRKPRAKIARQRRALQVRRAATELEAESRPRRTGGQARDESPQRRGRGSPATLPPSSSLPQELFSPLAAVGDRARVHGAISRPETREQPQRK